MGEKEEGKEKANIGFIPNPANQTRAFQKQGYWDCEKQITFAK